MLFLLLKYLSNTQLEVEIWDDGGGSVAAFLRVLTEATPGGWHALRVCQADKRTAFGRRTELERGRCFLPRFCSGRSPVAVVDNFLPASLLSTFEGDRPRATVRRSFITSAVDLFQLAAPRFNC